MSFTVCYCIIFNAVVSKHMFVFLGNNQEDPEFPKVQWPSKDLCPQCRKTIQGKETWDSLNVLRFLKQRYSESNISYEYLEDEMELLKKQREQANKNAAVEKETKDEKEEEAKPSSDDKTVPPVRPREEGNGESLLTARAEMIPRRKPSIIKMKANRALHGNEEEKILDLDAYENQHFRGRTLQDSNSKHHNRALHPKTLLVPDDNEFNEEVVRRRLLKRGIDTKHLVGAMVNEGDSNGKGSWVKMLEVDFSRLDISLCIILYFLTSMGLLAMYLYLSARSRFLRPRCRSLQP